MGWTPVLQDQWAAVTRQWCRLVNMNNNRITKYIFMYNELKGSPRCKNWNFRVKQFTNQLGFIICVIQTALMIFHLVLIILKMLCVSQMNKHGLIR